MDNSRPRALIVDLARYFGGAEVRVLDLARAFGSQNCSVVCLKDSPLAQRLNEAKLAPYELHEDKINPRLAFSLMNIMREQHFDLVDAHNVQSRGWVAACLPGLKKRPASVATVHSSIHQEHRNNAKGVIYKWLERSLLPGFDQVVTVSSFLHSELAGWKISQERISIVPNGVELKRVTKSEGAAFRHELGLMPDDYVVGCVGRLEPAKGHLYLLQAIAGLLPDWPQIHAVIVGEGRLRAKLDDFVQSHGLADHVHFTGFRNDIPRMLETFDLFALPSITEGIPIALLEACASAKPVVASQVGGVPEIIADGYSGLLVKPGDVEGLAYAIEVLMQDRELAERMGKQAEREVGERFSMTNMVQCTQQAYQLAIERRNARPS